MIDLDKSTYPTYTAERPADKTINGMIYFLIWVYFVAAIVLMVLVVCTLFTIL